MKFKSNPISNSSQEKKKTTITTKVSDEEKKHIQLKAQKAGLTTSDYIRRSALNKQLFATLSKEEQRLLNNLDGCRSDLLKLFTAIRGMKSDKRMELFQYVPNMVKWYQQVEPITNLVIDFLKSIYDLYGGSYKKSKPLCKIEENPN